MKKNLIAGGLILALTAALWALRIELTFERNVRHGLPANFNLRHRQSVPIWRV